MADVEHIFQLKKGSDKWNKWRNESCNKGIKPNFSNADIRGANLSGVNLSGANFSGANLSGVNFSGANLRRADFSMANLSQVNLNSVDLIDVNFKGANLSGADIRGVNLSGVNLSSANLGGANLSGASLSGANLSGISLIGSNLCLADFFEVNLNGINLNRVNLAGAKFNKANLSGASLVGANLNLANLNGVNLAGAKLNKANLNEASLVGANLSLADLREVNFSRINLNGANLSRANLAGANLTEANLDGANLDGTNLNRANLTRANLKKTSLKIAQALGTDFTEAVLTGACIQDWHIHSATNLGKVFCEYIYLKDMGQERRPSDLNRIFSPGEFSKLFQKALETVDLIFADGIDWTAFVLSFQELQKKYSDNEISIQAIERKWDGAFVIRLEVNSTVDKAFIERQAKAFYENELQALESQYRAELQAKDCEIRIYRQQSADFLEITKLLATRPINVEANAVSKSHSDSNIFNNDLREANVGNFANQVKDSARQKSKQYNYESPEKQTLAEAAEEIQHLLKQLEETNPTAPEIDQIAYVNAATKSELKQRAISALKAGGESAIDEFLIENKYLKVCKAVVKAWLEAS